MIPKPVDQIELADLEALIGTVREGKTIEFKQQLPARSEPEKVQFLKAAVSFANTSCGDDRRGAA
jgi:predicted HTH transcriptional regulator